MLYIPTQYRTRVLYPVSMHARMLLEYRHAMAGLEKRFPSHSFGFRYEARRDPEYFKAAINCRTPKATRDVPQFIRDVPY